MWAALLGFIKAIMAGLVYYAGREQGRRVEKIEQQEENYEAMQEHIRKLETRPVTDDDFDRLFAQARDKAKAREDAER